MSDISVTASAVVATSSTTTAQGPSASAITAGQQLYLNSSSLLVPGNAVTGAPSAAACVGVAMTSAPGAGQPVVYANGGDITINAVLTAGTIYVVSATNGGIAPSADLDSASTWYATILGVATSTTNLRLAIKASGAVNA